MFFAKAPTEDAKRWQEDDCFTNDVHDCATQEAMLLYKSRVGKVTLWFFQTQQYIPISIAYNHLLLLRTFVCFGGEAGASQEQLHS